MLKKLLSQAVLLLAMTFATTANAVLITQDINVDDAGFTLGSISIQIDDADLGNGLVSVSEFADLTLFGISDLDVFGFEAVIDTNNIYAGIEFLFFDVQEIGFDFWNYQLIYDNFAPGANFVDIFDSTGPVFFSTEISLGEHKSFQSQLQLYYC